MKLFFISAVFAAVSSLLKIICIKFFTSEYYSIIISLLSTGAAAGSALFGSYYRVHPERVRIAGKKSIKINIFSLIYAIILLIVLMMVLKNINVIMIISCIILVSLFTGLHELLGMKAVIMENKLALAKIELIGVAPMVILMGVTLIWSESYITLFFSTAISLYILINLNKLEFQNGVVVLIDNKNSAQIGNIIASANIYLLPLLLLIAFGPEGSAKMIAAIYIFTIAMSINMLFINRIMYSSKKMSSANIILLLFGIVLEIIVLVFVSRYFEVLSDEESYFSKLLTASLFILIGGKAYYNFEYSKTRINNIYNRKVIYIELWRFLVLFIGIFTAPGLPLATQLTAVLATMGASSIISAYGYSRLSRKIQHG
jgi:hypothetical protein